MSGCFKWFSKTSVSTKREPTKDNNEISFCPFENIPVIVLAKILDDRSCLTVEDLKSARLVCKLWHSVISDIQLLTKKSLALAFRGNDSLLKIKYSKLVPKETKHFWMFIPHHFRWKIPIHGTTFRFQNSSASLVRDWLRFFKTKHIKCLELDFGILPAKVLTECIYTSMKNLESLTLTDSFIYEPHRSTKKFDKLIKSSFSGMKTLTVNVNHPWFYANIMHTRNRAFPVPNFLSTALISSLVTLNIKVTDTGNAEIDKRGHFQTLFKTVGLIIKNNAKTLRNVAIITHDITNDRNYRTFLYYPKILSYPHIKEAPNEDQHFLFDYFLEEMKVLSWMDYGLQLQKLTLAFRLLHLKRTSLVDDTLKPFLKSMTSLQEISISQIYTQNREYFNEVFGCLFNRCTKCHFVEVYHLNPRIENEGEIHGYLQYYLERNNPDHFGTFIKRFNESGEKLKTKVVGISKLVQIRDISSELATPNITSVVRFSRWKSLSGVAFFKNNINFLTKIKIDHGAHTWGNKLVVKDEDLQTIFRSGNMLRELSFHNCNLQGVTDYGLTGIRTVARMRMLLSKILSLETFDFVVDVPLSNLKKLRTFHFGNAGPNITRISAMFAFNGLEKLDSCQLQFIHSLGAVIPALKFHFPHKREVTQFPTCQYETYEKVKL